MIVDGCQRHVYCYENLKRKQDNENLKRKQDTLCKYNVTLLSVRATIVAKERKGYFTF